MIHFVLPTEEGRQRRRKQREDRRIRKATRKLNREERKYRKDYADGEITEKTFYNLMASLQKKRKELGIVEQNQTAQLNN
ncbi:hypothetical protein E1J53_0018890 [Lewinella sp. W8]|nr:hypothetical protein [Lewinella sp. W8]